MVEVILCTLLTGCRGWEAAAAGGARRDVREAMRDAAADAPLDEDVSDGRLRLLLGLALPVLAPTTAGVETAPVLDLDLQHFLFIAFAQQHPTTV